MSGSNMFLVVGHNPVGIFQLTNYFFKLHIQAIRCVLKDRQIFVN